MTQEDRLMQSFHLPDNLLLGVATAAVQIEGGDTNNSWYRWCRQKDRIADGTNCDVADDHWNRVDEDIALMQRLNVHTYRMGLEWSRIEPRPGQFDTTAVAHYRDEIEKLVAAGIITIVTLHHFSNPLWLEDQGAWLNPDVIPAFENYTAFIYQQLGDFVSDWVTINEPNVYLMFGYVQGIWPPGEQNMRHYFKGARNMIGAHIAAYKKIHAIAEKRGNGHANVGVAHHLRVFEPGRGHRSDKWICALFDRLFHQLFITGMSEGRLLFPVGRGYPFGRGLFQDFFGINYYSRDMVCFKLGKIGQLFGELTVKPDAPKNDLGWEIYPQGLYDLCRRYYRRFKQPIFILENGTGDGTDAFRSRYIFDHLHQVKRLLNDGVDVQRYYHWTLMDNFEWAEGLSARFGLIEVDYDTQQRSIRNSGHFFSDICRKRGITREMIAEYLHNGIAPE